ncbi:hypothetical protein WCLP8_5200004 [uncultured Gammaproteobacteria bacterium]
MAGGEHWLGQRAHHSGSWYDRNTYDRQPGSLIGVSAYDRTNLSGGAPRGRSRFRVGDSGANYDQGWGADDRGSARG